VTGAAGCSSIYAPALALSVKTGCAPADDAGFACGAGAGLAGSCGVSVAGGGGSDAVVDFPVPANTPAWIRVRGFSAVRGEGGYNLTVSWSAGWVARRHACVPGHRVGACVALEM
jgi:hypothetical protein